MERLKKDQAVVVSAYTGFLICNFSDMHEEIEKRLKRPVMTHELAYHDVHDEIKAAFKDSFLSLLPEVYL